MQNTILDRFFACKNLKDFYILRQQLWDEADSYDKKNKCHEDWKSDLNKVQQINFYIQRAEATISAIEGSGKTILDERESDGAVSTERWAGIVSARTEKREPKFVYDSGRNAKLIDGECYYAFWANDCVSIVEWRADTKTFKHLKQVKGDVDAIFTTRKATRIARLMSPNQHPPIRTTNESEPSAEHL